MTRTWGKGNGTRESRAIEPGVTLSFQPPDPGGFLGLSQQPGWAWFPQQPRSLLILAQLLRITMASFRPKGMGRNKLAIGVNEKLLLPNMRF